MIKSYKLRAQERIRIISFIIAKDVGHNDWKNSESNEFRGVEDRNMSKNKIDLLLWEVHKVGHQMECLSLQFELLEREFNEVRNQLLL